LRFLGFYEQISNLLLELGLSIKS